MFLNDFYESIKISEIKNSASTIVKNINSENLGELVDQIARNNAVCIEIILENGREVYTSDRIGDCVIYRMSIREKMKLLINTQKNGGELLQYYNRNNFRENNILGDRMIGREPRSFRGVQQSIIYSKIMTDIDGKTVVLLINSVISPVDATVKTLRTQLYYITGFMLLFSVFLALIISKKVATPIEKINESAKVLAMGNYNIFFSGNGYKEINELSDTLNNAAKELSKVDHLRKELIANISHDLRTPLTLISGYAEVMCDLPNEMTKENAQIIVDETKRLTSLVNDVLDISKIESGNYEIEKSQFNMTQSINKTINRLNELIKKDGYIIEYIYDKEVIIRADEIKISQAIYNLLINAINYTGKDKTIIVKQTVMNEDVKIEVIDSGEGIEAEHLPYIWDRYYKANQTHRRAITGTGLGLSIVKSVIELHEGEYGVTSTHGQGSIFWFVLKL
ncbi:sensor histidine kinase [Serpentinicella alkaliphila]|nr:HAMP domain-containing sensor histidine kinase [Serpentinicella alkaliphila]